MFTPVEATITCERFDIRVTEVCEKTRYAYDYHCYYYNISMQRGRNFG